ncbi:hypothetical protein NQ314_010127 [Rhamnusium bicolor]|uniref:non-specific serine/threonine protein kinase n=1 Tax=Rhamnusium bicolor TaxID=1586634 RepID=A0AAV8XUX3_9CUCU|nr:hypothetical protein NQ314_010127 [Rhamnusium bicolor]
MDKYEVIGPLGEGSFGRVYKAKQVSDGCFVALKVISKIVVITEFAHKELTTVLGKEGYLSEERVQPIVWDLVSALYYLHSNRVLHRDLKPQNILLDSKNSAKLCDFGFARNMSTGTHVLTSIKGTPLYMAPELIDEQPYDYNADLWSLGCIIYELLMGTPPFCTASILHLIRLIRHEQIQWPTFLSENCTSFLKASIITKFCGLLQKNPAKRMTWEEILSHPFVKGHIQISKNTTHMPLTRPLSANTLQVKEQQRKDSIKNKHVKSTSSRSAETNDHDQPHTSDQKKPITPKNSKTSQNSNNVEGSKKPNNQDIKNNNMVLDEDMENLSLEIKNIAPKNMKNQNKSQASNVSKKNVETSTEICTERDDFKEKLNFIEDNHPIETDEWIMFLQKSIQEVINGEMASLLQPSQTNIIVSPLRNSNANSKVLSFVAKLLSIPFVLKGTTEDTLSKIKEVYLEIKLVPNLVYASKLLLREFRGETPSGASPSPNNSPLPSAIENYRALSELSEEDFQALEYMFLLISHLVYVDDNFLIQFCDSVVVLNVYVLMKLMLLLSKQKIRIVLDVIAILTHLLRKFPENNDIIEKILLNESNNADIKQINFVDLLRHSNLLLRERTCYFLLLVSKTLPENTVKIFWNSTLRETLEALMYDSIETVRNVSSFSTVS